MEKGACKNKIVIKLEFLLMKYLGFSLNRK